MAVKIIKGKMLPIGVDLGSSAVKLAQLRVTDSSYELIAAAASDVPPACRGDFQARLGFYSTAIRQMLRAHNFHGRECVLSLPAELTFVHHVRIPKTHPDQVQAAVLRETQGKLPFSAGEAEIRHIVAGDVLGEGEARQEVIVVAVPRSIILNHLAVARRAKLDVAAINVEPCAIVECFGRLFRRTNDQKRTILFVDVGQASTQVVLSHGNRIVFARNVGIAGDQLDRAIAEGVNIPPEQAQQIRRDLASSEERTSSEEELYGLLAEPLAALAGELTQCLRYYESVFRNQSIERAIFLGGQARDRRLCQSIAQHLNLPAQIGDPLVRIVTAQDGSLDAGLDRREPQPRWAVAVGLSIGGEAA